MYLIALCDDQSAESEKIEKLLSDYEKKHSGLDLITRRFENADDLLYLIQEENYMPDLIFMDIYMPDQKGASYPSGIEAAKKLRSMDYRGMLIFLTTSKEFALEAFDVDALQYIVKPVSEDKLFLALDRLLKDIEEKREKYILLRTEGRLVRVSLDDIVCCEAQGKTQWLYLINGTRYLLRMTMTKIYELLSHYPEFVRLGAAFIVNLGYIGSLNAKELYMEDGMKIFLPRGTYKDLREQYFRYYCEQEKFF